MLFLIGGVVGDYEKFFTKEKRQMLSDMRGDPKPKVKGKSKLKKWTCGCQIVRVGKREFCATCDICNNKFQLDE